MEHFRLQKNRLTGSLCGSTEDQIMNYTYMLRCRDDSLYTGWTNDLERRLKAHNFGKGAHYTKARRPCRLVFFERSDTKEEAMRREYRIKQMTRKEKEKLIAGLPEEDLRSIEEVNSHCCL